MLYAVAQELPGISLEMSHRVLAGAGKGNPPGLILRAAGEAGGNVRMVEVWESTEDRARFVTLRIGAARAKLAGGVAPPPPPHDHFEIDITDLVLRERNAHHG